MRGADALALAREYQPTAVSLDVFLPDMLGWTVLSQLKQNPATRHIPVQIVTLDEDRQHGLARGAFSFITKPTTTEGLEIALSNITNYTKPRRKRLLVVEDNPAEQLSITELLGHDDIDIELVETGKHAIARLQEEPAIASCWICGCPTCPASRYWSGSATRTAWPTFRSWCSPAASCRRKRMRSFTPWPAASW
jgi:CheY-like chemotaxis protein